MEHTRLIAFIVLSVLCGVTIVTRQSQASPMRSTWYAFPTNRITACGQHFNMNDSTIAAHRTLPCGTILSVTNPRNGRKIRMVVQDRGPFALGYSLDVSYAAARKLGFLTQGIATLDVEVVGVP
jgi:rare lipoprotein A